MKIKKYSIICILLCTMILGGVHSTIKGMNINADNNIKNIGTNEHNSLNQSLNDNKINIFSDVFLENNKPLNNVEVGKTIETFPSETDSFVKDYLIDETDQSSPFFETVLPRIKANIQVNDKHSVNKHFDKLPVANNPRNFQGLNTTQYANINGKTVTTESFYRVYGESLNDPNCGMGLLLYQCIQYKLKHPEEDVKITFSSYRTSVTASVCVIPESKYYGYMRSLFGTNYDEHGFVRISYMLVEAARMGIEVTMINQLPSYGTKQYTAKTNSLKNRSHINFKDYFNVALPTECYNSYVGEGKKVSDYLNMVNVEWTIEDQHVYMHHLKSFSVSHYLATDGSEHGSAVFFSSANLDENDYIGRNGNSYSQSGVIVSDHDELFRVHYNYNKLLTKFGHQEGMQELRMVMADLNNKQIPLILSGRENEIADDEQIVYLGSESDSIFELYFPPLGGGVDAWNTDFNPICKYLSKLPLSEDYIEYTNLQYGYGRSYVGYMIESMLEVAFCNNPNPKNKITIRIKDFNTDAIQKLELGTEIGHRLITDGSKIHAKDFLLSYVENGKRHYISIMTSCNLYMMAFNYRSNSILVIHETEDTGSDFYTGFGEKYSSGMITAN